MVCLGKIDLPMKPPWIKLSIALIPCNKLKEKVHDEESFYTKDLRSLFAFSSLNNSHVQYCLYIINLNKLFCLL